MRKKYNRHSHGSQPQQETHPHSVTAQYSVHTKCTRTTTTICGCHPPSTVLVGANNNSNVVYTEGSPTHTARHGPAPLCTLTLTHTQKWEENSVQQRPHAGRTNHTRRNGDASR
ncbi:hypothetical protein TcCL_NonESM09437 [Trypanosoma cruzi]|nr:hypothetical protein TcCL_NonESM09437 [Trypanosoma cruzi]